MLLIASWAISRTVPALATEALSVAASLSNSGKALRSSISPREKAAE
jgi:hypothetical protein